MYSEFDSSARHIVNKPTPLAHLVAVPQDDVAEGVVPLLLSEQDEQVVMLIPQPMAVLQAWMECTRRPTMSSPVIVACDVPLKTVESCGQKPASSRQ
jgi:hypothetical protein